MIGICVAGKSVSLKAEATVATSKNFKYNLFFFKAPKELNVLGLSGSVSLTNTSNYFAEDLVTLGFYSTAGECPLGDSGSAFDSQDEIDAKYGKGKLSMDFSFILKSVKPGTVSVPTDISLPVKRHSSGCLYINLIGNELVHNSTVKFNSDMVLRYDTQSASSVQLREPLYPPFGYEEVYGLSTAIVTPPAPTEKNAFANAQTINSYLNLWQIHGNVSASALTGGASGGFTFANAPTGAWKSDFDYYVYPSCNNLFGGESAPLGDKFYGPDDYYGKIPAGAVKLASTQFNGNGAQAFQAPVVYQFSPMLLRPGNCLVGLTRFVSSSTGGDNESQVHTLVENIQGSILGRVFIDANGNGQYDAGEQFVQDTTAACSSGTKMAGVNINWSGMVSGQAVSDKTNANLCNPDPYFSTDVPAGTLQISLQLPSGWKTTVTVEAGKSQALMIGIKQTSTCTNECPTSGATQCSSSSVQTCGDVNVDGCLEWSAAKDCASGQTCQNGACAAACVPKTCASLNYNCGAAGDSCGGTLDCGLCAGGKTCSANVCVATGPGGGSSSGGGSTTTTTITTVAKTGNSSSGGGGSSTPAKPVAKMTRAEILAAIAQIQALIADLQKQLAAMTGSPSQNATANQSSTFSCAQIAKNLFYGMASDPQVKCLQEVLKSQGYAVVVSGNYDIITKTAVVFFQQKYAGEILTPYHLTRGSGNVGNATLAKINELMK